jgi:leucyl-tRNA synthetase
MSGFNVFHPMGFDTFGLPAERYALKNNISPVLSVARNVANFKDELRSLALLHTPSSSLMTSDTEFYRWTQWCFIQFFQHWYDSKAGRARPISEFALEYGKEKFEQLSPVEQCRVLNGVRLAYLDYDYVNWCEELSCILADEELDEDGKSLLGGHDVERRKMLQWKLRITAYAERLLNSLKKLDWPDGTVNSQKNWIGKRIALFLRFYCESDKKQYIELELKRPELIDKIERLQLTSQSRGKSERYLNPVTLKQISVEIAEEEGIVYRERVSEKDAGLNSIDEKLREQLLSDGHLVEKTLYNLRDWNFSRQRYWGEPIPIIYADGLYLPEALDEVSLPLELPLFDELKNTQKTTTIHNDIGKTLFDIKSKSESDIELPLDKVERWKSFVCNEQFYHRETNVMPQWAGSSWYYIRYLSPKCRERLVDEKRERYWLENGIDLYIGGREHSNTHLLYARFWHKFLYDIGAVSHDEPFRKLRHQGYITAYTYRKLNGEYVEPERVSKIGDEYRCDGEKVRVGFGKMGKSLKNSISHSELCNTYGSDAYRLHILYGAPLDVTRNFSVSEILGMSRFLKRLFNFSEQCEKNEGQQKLSKLSVEVKFAIRECISTNIRAIEELKFNVGIAAIIKLLHLLSQKRCYGREVLKLLLRMLHPYAPILTEELWSRFSMPSPLFANANFPHVDEIGVKSDSETKSNLVVQVNGKKRYILRDISEKTERNKVIELAKNKIKPEEREQIKRIFYKKNVINFIL